VSAHSPEFCARISLTSALQAEFWHMFGLMSGLQAGFGAARAWGMRFSASTLQGACESSRRRTG
jgi:Na+/glutamate symporter